ncbi:tRNA pseudouridine synthase A [Nitrosococcus halophilus Nc 4]|uniref:tRNA pseudouridine synthase A n=1 Tax=Nitrosococcus halophilus (strain Nc4) TaxID=472759 RepID=D5C3V3_NITHN|nr:tRNA pseudouridine(38-40) synthase TruA [Nitrosococcus halophilus]ADE15075.1 tRNA pseudouridine synthase A [Nitrosococcus halophilus Nc 4]
MRIAFGVEYEGSSFCGWQSQRGVPTVQATLEEAVSKVANQPITVITAGRTDAGVHAAAQVVHFDTTASRLEHNWIFGCNMNLPPEVVVLWAQPVDETFHARFSAVARHYRYVILNRRVRPAIANRRVTWYCHPLSVSRMREGGAHLIGEHDFSSFRAKACQAKSPIRNVHRLEVRRQEDFVVIDISANAFLHHMVRNIAGVLMAVGKGEQPPCWVEEVLQARCRALGSVTARPDGLYLMGVDYPDHFNLPRLSRPVTVW